jgi:hypothetical protein
MIEKSRKRIWTALFSFRKNKLIVCHFLYLDFFFHFAILSVLSLLQAWKKIFLQARLSLFIHWMQQFSSIQILPLYALIS